VKPIDRCPILVSRLFEASRLNLKACIGDLELSLGRWTSSDWPEYLKKGRLVWRSHHVYALKLGVKASR
jgi:hypothetical protein